MHPVLGGIKCTVCQLQVGLNVRIDSIFRIWFKICAVLYKCLGPSLMSNLTKQHSVPDNLATDSSHLPLLSNLHVLAALWLHKTPDSQGCLNPGNNTWEWISVWQTSCIGSSKFQLEINWHVHLLFLILEQYESSRSVLTAQMVWTVEKDWINVRPILLFLKS